MIRFWVHWHRYIEYAFNEKKKGPICVDLRTVFMLMNIFLEFLTLLELKLYPMFILK